MINKLTPEQMKVKREEKQALIEAHSRENEDFGTFIASVPTLYRAKAYDVYSGSKNLRRSIDMKCLDYCCYVRQEVADCTVRRCPLYHVRPYQEKQ
jgi:hypothetical protein